MNKQKIQNNQDTTEEKEKYGETGLTKLLIRDKEGHFIMIKDQFINRTR